MKLLRIETSDRPDKRYTAIFDDSGQAMKKNKTVHFGQKGGKTYIDHHDEIKRKNYIERHRMLNENWSHPNTPGSLARHLLWGDHKTLAENIKSFKSRFNI